MNRFFGMMPMDEVEITKTYKDSNNRTILIEAGPDGYTIIFADHSTKYRDVMNDTEQNFKEAYRVATNLLGELTEYEQKLESAVLSSDSL